MPTTIDLVLDRTEVHHTPDQLHGLACALLEGPGAEHEAGTKSFTAWPLRSTAAGDALRLTLLDDQDHRGRPIASVLRLGSTRFLVRDRVDTFIPYAELLARSGKRQTTLLFETPTYFSRNGRDLPLPDPVLVFRSLALRWNTHAPAALRIDDERLRLLLGAIVLLEANVHTLSASSAHRHTRTGFVGTATFGLTREGHSTAVEHATLAAAAEFFGVGAQTTRGFGVVSESARKPEDLRWAHS